METACAFRGTRAPLLAAAALLLTATAARADGVIQLAGIAEDARSSYFALPGSDRYAPPGSDRAEFAPTGGRSGHGARPDRTAWIEMGLLGALSLWTLPRLLPPFPTDDTSLRRLEDGEGLDFRFAALGPGGIEDALPRSGAAAALPEPGALSLALLGLGAAPLVRRRGHSSSERRPLAR